jgi:catalase
VARRIDAKESADKVRIKPEKFADHYTQARLFFESQSEVEKAHIGNAFRFELSKVTVPAIRERMVASLRNASPELAARLAQDLGMDLPAPLPKALENPAKPEVESSPALSLMARPGDGGIRTRKIAVLVANGVEGKSLGKLVSSLVAAGAVPRLVAARLGTYVGIGGEKFAADATMENSPAFLFDALVLPDGEDAVASLDTDAHTLEFLRVQYWHCKTILAFGASQALLTEAQIPLAMPDGSADPGLVLADASAADEAIADFIDAMGKQRHFGRENDPPVA